MWPALYLEKDLWSARFSFISKTVKETSASKYFNRRKRRQEYWYEYDVNDSSHNIKTNLGLTDNPSEE